MAMRLSLQHFARERALNGGIQWCVRITGISFVVYYASTDELSSRFVGEVFRPMSSSVSGCTFAECNLTEQPDIVSHITQSTTPIQFVPAMILYVNGRPVKLFPPNIDRTRGNIQKWIVRSIQTQDFVVQEDSHRAAVREDPAGNPHYHLTEAERIMGITAYNRLDLAHLTYMEAYPPDREQRR